MDRNSDPSTHPRHSRHRLLYRICLDENIPLKQDPSWIRTSLPFPHLFLPPVIAPFLSFDQNYVKNQRSTQYLAYVCEVHVQCTGFPTKKIKFNDDLKLQKINLSVEFSFLFLTWLLNDCQSLTKKLTDKQNKESQVLKVSLLR